MQNFKEITLNFSIDIWLQAIANGLALGWLYVLMALGMMLMLSIMGILQLAHGEIYMFSAYLVFTLYSTYHFNLYLAIFTIMILMGIVGLFLERILFRPRPNRDPVLASIVISVGLTLILTSAVVVIFGLYQKSLPLLLFGSFSIAGGGVPKDRVLAIAFSVAAFLSLYLFLKKTRWGQAMTASAQNREGSFLKGINPNQMSMMAVAIGCALAGLAGGLGGAILQIQPYMGSLPMVKGLVIIVLGGLGSIPGALAGGIILGLIDGVVPVIFGSAVAAIAPLIIVIAILLLRPRGMFGHD
jgi:branched-chain amino acid transport system permease protein